MFKFINKYLGGPLFLILLILLSALPYVFYYYGLLYIYDYVSKLEFLDDNYSDWIKTYAIIIIAPNGSVFVWMIFLVFLHKWMIKIIHHKMMKSSTNGDLMDFFDIIPVGKLIHSFSNDIIYIEDNLV